MLRAKEEDLKTMEKRFRHVLTAFFFWSQFPFGACTHILIKEYHTWCSLNVRTRVPLM